MTALIKYDAACRALAECKAIDEVKGWADKAAAMQAYGRMAKDKTLEVDAAEIRIRAERRLGEMLAAQKADGGLNGGTKMTGAKPGANDGSSAVVANDHRPKLADAGISKDLSSRAQKLAAVPEAEFEAEVGEWRDRVSAEGARVTTRLEKAGERELRKNAKTLPEDEAYAPPAPANHELEEAISTINELAAENDQLRDRVAIAAMSGTDEERAMAAETIAELRDQIKTLEAELDAVRTSRDTFQQQNAELMKQVRLQQKQIKKMGG